MNITKIQRQYYVSLELEYKNIKMITEQNLYVLAQFINALNEACNKLEESYVKKDIENFEKSKKLILELKSKIDSLLQ